MNPKTKFFLLGCLLFGVFLVSLFSDQQVVFQDENFESAIRGVLRHSGKPIYRSQLLDIVELNLENQDISDLSGIEHFRNLEVLILRRNAIEDVSQLRTLNNLKVLDLSYNRIVDLEEAGFNTLIHIPLTTLSLEHNLSLDETSSVIRLSNIILLGQFPTINELNLADNHVQDFSVLADLPNLTALDLSENKIVNIDDLKNLGQLQRLNLLDNDIIDLSPLGNLVNLQYLNLHSNSNIISIKPIENLHNLKTLILRNVPVGDEIFVLRDMNKLSRLNLRNSSVSDLTILAKLMQKGALQDNPELGIQAYVDLLENEFDQNPQYLISLVPYWENIHTRYPYLLNYATMAPPTFSSTGGFYPESFHLTFSSSIENSRIFYTLDGSIPTAESKEFDQPVWIQAQTPLAEEYARATVVRARAFSEDLDEVSPVVTHTFFVGQRNDFPISLPLVSMAINPEHLFDEEMGLYVQDNAFQRGLKWERPAHIEFYELDGHQGFIKNINIRIHGVVSRSLPQKSFRIYANVDYEDGKTIDYEVFPGYQQQLSGLPVNQFKTLLLRNSGTDHQRTMFRDAFVQSLTDLTTLDTQAYRPAILYVNGEYWGIYNLRERIDAFYLSNHYNVHPEDVDFLQFVANVGLVGDEDAMDGYLALTQFITDHDITDDTVLARVATMMDLENFTDYQILQIYSANLDWPQNNQVFWRLRTSEYDPEKPSGIDGRWRWILFDLDFSFRNYSLNLMKHATRDDPSAFLLQTLLKNEAFRLHFINRFADLLNSSFTTPHVLQKMEIMQQVIEPEIGSHINRWFLPESMDVWLQYIENKKAFAEFRPQVMQDHLLKYFNLPGTFQVAIHTDSRAGYIQINSLEIKPSIPGVSDPADWTGMYFQGVPITLTAHAYPGFRFVRWESSIDGIVVDQGLTISATEDVLIEAIFAPLE